MLAFLHGLVGNTRSELVLGEDQRAKFTNLIPDAVVLLAQEENEIA
jgi:hypothetical protein